MDLKRIFNKHTAADAAWTGVGVALTVINLQSAFHGSVLGMGLAAFMGYVTYQSGKRWYDKAKGGPRY